MSNLIPPLLSSSPPPIVGPLDDEDDDEFGDFRAAEDSYDCDDFSLPPTPHKSPQKEKLDINRNNSQKNVSINSCEQIEKDFQDRRKNDFDVNSIHSQSETIKTTLEESTDEDISEISNNVDHCTDLQPNEVLTTITNCEVQKQQNENTESVNNIEEVLDQCNLEKLPEVVNNDIKVEIDEEDSIIQNNSKISESSISFKIDDSDTKLSDEDEFGVFENHFDAKFDTLPQNEELANQSPISQKANNSIVPITSEEIQVDEDEFDDFVASSPVVQQQVDEVIKESQSPEIEDEFDDFIGSFPNTKLDEEVNEGKEMNEFDSEMPPPPFPKRDNCDEFVSELPPVPPPQQENSDEFDEFISELPLVSSQQQANDDEFGDFESSNFAKADGFGDFSTCDKSPVVEVDIKNAVANSETILKEMFPVIGDKVVDFENIDQIEGNLIFDELKDVTETKALMYQWSKSNSQKMFLKALNIDMRNILYGPNWQGSMPKFAANLGLTPLEPVKSEILSANPIQNNSSPSNSSQKNASDIPTAQFDWTGSGLVNPLDYLEQLVATLDIPSTNPSQNQSPSPSNDLLDEWDLWLQSAAVEPAPGIVSQDPSQPLKTENLSSEKIDPITNLFIEENSGKTSSTATTITQIVDFSPFQSPKIVPLRETYISNENLEKPGWLEPTIVTPDLPRKETNVVEQDEDDEFDDFQMVLPDEGNKSDKTNLSEFGTLNKPVHNQEHILEPNIVQNQKEEDDDEFSDFHSSVPLPPQLPIVEVLKPLQPVPLEPLKPTIQYKTSALSTQINWPDPGVTDDDIRNIELNYSRQIQPKSDVVPKLELLKKDKSWDDDEWTDFVSVTSPIKERTATPDLPLSVMNLNHVQAPKQPIPVITPNGLVQTKLSTNVLNVVQTTMPTNVYKQLQPIQFQPSIISTQFAAQNHQIDDDDDWSEFVSSQPVPPQSNGYHQEKMIGKGGQFNWTNATTNIIMNPSHFDSFQTNYVSSQQQKKVTSGRNTIPSISAMPDLDFIAPKNRTSKK